MVRLEFTMKGGTKILLKGQDNGFRICKARPRKVRKTGDTAWEPFAYCTSLRAALIQILDMKIRTADAKTLKELAANLAEARREITVIAARIAAKNDESPN